MANSVSYASSVDASGPIELLGGVLPRAVGPALKKGAGRAAYQIQQLMRSELDRLIYSTPESPDYQRTHTLYRSTYASRPGADHSRDHDAAKSGVDLGVSENVAGGVVALTGTVAKIDVGAWANYAWFVHEGYGQGNRIPKPFSQKAVEQGPEIFMNSVYDAVIETLLAIPFASVR